MTTSTPAALPKWSSRAYAENDRDDVLDLFADPGFFFRTAQPDTRPEHELLALIDEDTRLLFGDNTFLGLYATEEIGSAHGCHFMLHLRLRASAPDSWWCAAYREVAAALRWRQEIVRLSLQIGEFDDRGLAVARELGLDHEGTLANVVVHDGRSYGLACFAQIWTPS